jgi:Uma2 family endonuclease
LVALAAHPRANIGRASLRHHPGADHYMGMHAASTRRWTVDDVHGLIEEQLDPWPRYELVDGELLVTPSASMQHERALNWLHRRVDAYCESEGVGELFASPSELRLVAGTIVQPDRFVVARGNAGAARTWSEVQRVLLVIEALSPSTARSDRGKKRELYQAAGVDEYWIVDLESRVVERWLPNDDRPEVIRDRLVWHPADAASPLVVEVSELWKAARLD